MHTIFAIQPDIINSWDRARYILEKFGYSTGALIGVLPKNWERQVINTADSNNIKPVEKLKLTEILNKAKTRKLIKLGYDYNNQLNWIENAVSAYGNKRIDKIIANYTELQPVITYDDLSETDFEGLNEFSPKRNAKELASAGRFILEKAKTLILIDPYFNSRIGNTAVLKEIIGLIKPNSPFSIDIHASQAQHDKESRICHKFYYRELKQWIDVGWSLNIHLWHNDLSDRHPRFLITDKGGLQYDRGFIEPSDITERNNITPVHCISDKRINEQLQIYSNNHPDFCKIIHINQLSAI